MSSDTTERLGEAPTQLAMEAMRGLGWPADQVGAQLVREMRAARTTFLEQASARFARFEPYRGLGPGVVADVVASVGRVYDTFLDCLAEDRGLTPQELARLEREGSKRAKQGVPLDAVEAMFRAGLHDAMSMLHDLATDAVGDDPAGMGVVAKFDMTLAGLALAAVGAMAQGHRRMDGDVAKTISEFVSAADGAGPASAAQAGRMYALIVLVPFGSTDVAAMASVVRALVDGRMPAAASPPAHLPKLHRAVVARPTGDAELEDACSRIAREHGLGVAVSRFRSVADGIRSYDIIRDHLHVVHDPAGTPRVLNERDITYRAMLESLDDHLVARLVDSILGAILELSEAERGVVIEQLDCALDVWGNKTQMARALGTHRKAVYALLDRVEELTGLCANDVRSALLLRLAVDAVNLPGQP